MAIIDRGIIRSHRKSKKLISLFLMIILALSLITISFLELQESEPDSLESPTPVRITYITHDPISIDGNSGFTNASGVGWGSGTASDPYIIEDLDINASSGNGILIQNTDEHFIIRNCYIHDGGEVNTGIWLDYSANGTLTNNTCSNNDYGIYLQSSSNNTLTNNTCNWNKFIGIFLLSSSNNTLSNNNCSSNSINGYGISLAQSSNNTLSNNNCSSNDDYGIILFSSSNNEIIWNQICNNSLYGVTTDSLTFNNRIWNNTFIGNNGTQSIYDPNQIQANDDGTNNLWNSSDYGNYWSDWTTPDDNLDGIVDDPYDIDGSAGAKDYYPQTNAPIIPEPPIFILTAIMIMIFLIFGRTREKNK